MTRLTSVTASESMMKCRATHRNQSRRQSSNNYTRRRWLLLLVFKSEQCIWTLKGYRTNNLAWYSRSHWLTKKHSCEPNHVIHMKIYVAFCPISLWNSWSSLTSQDASDGCTVWNNKAISPQLRKHLSREVWSDLCGSLCRQCLVYLLCSRFLSEAVLKNHQQDGFKHGLTVKALNEKRQAQSDLRVVCAKGLWCGTRGH